MQTRPIVLVVVSAVLAAATAAADTPAEKCEAGKLKEAGKFLLCRLKAEAKAVPGGAADTAKCDAKLASKWAGLESKAAGACPTNGDAGAEGEALAGDVAQTAWRLSGVPRFVDNGDGTITDRLSRRMWQKKVAGDGITDAGNPHDADNGYPWAGLCQFDLGKYCQLTSAASEICGLTAEGGVGCSMCLGGEGACLFAEETIWTYVVALNAAGFAGYSDWRLPTRAEWLEIVDYGDPTPPVVAAAFDGANCGTACVDLADPACSCITADYHWTASTQASSPEPWVVDFLDGGVLIGDTTASRRIRAVRDLP